MTREEAIKIIRKMLAYTDLTVRANLNADMVSACNLAIKALEQEPIDYKTQYENYLKKSKVVISQLRADRDRLQDALNKVRTEIVELTKCPYGTECLGANCPSNTDCMICGDHVLEIIDKYRTGTEEENVSL